MTLRTAFALLLLMSFVVALAGSLLAAAFLAASAALAVAFSPDEEHRDAHGRNHARRIR